MTIIKLAHRDTHYVTIRRETVQDETLSWEARGMLAYLLSKPLDWTVRPSQLQQGCGRDKVYSILRELSEHGYVARTDKRDANGRVLEVEYVVYEAAENPLPFPEKPYTVNPNTENHPLQIKEITKEREYTSPNGAQRENSEEPNNETSNHLSVDTPLAEPVSEPKTRKQSKTTVAATPRKEPPNEPTWQALAKARFGTLELDKRSETFIWSLQASAWDVYKSARAELVASLSDIEARERCAKGVVAFETEWNKRVAGDGKPLGKIKNRDTYAVEFRTFLAEHAPKQHTQPPTPRDWLPSPSTTAAPPRFKLPSESFTQKASEGGDNA